MRSSGCWLVLMGVLTVPTMAGDAAFQGDVEVSFRNVHGDGNEDKYREDVNLNDDALYLSNLQLDYRPENGSFFDSLSVDATGVGNEPYRSAYFRMQKADRYDLSLGYRHSEYFYRDAGYFFREQGDLHTWNANRDSLQLDFRIKTWEWLTLRFGARGSERDGGSSSSRDIQRDVFSLRRPIDQNSDSYWAGADMRFSWVDITLEQRYTTADNRWLLNAAGTDGEEAGGAFLDRYGQDSVEDSHAPSSRVQVRGRPVDWFRFTVGYAHIEADVDFETKGQWNGLDFTGAAFSTNLANSGDVERDSDLWDIDLSFAVMDSLEVIIDYSHREYDQDGSIDSREEQIGGDEAGFFLVRGDLSNRLELETYGLTVDWQATATFGVAVGVGRQERCKAFELSGPEVETDRTLYRARFRWRPTPMWNFRLDLEQGDDDGPVTPVSPTSTDRIRFRAEVRPIEGLSVSLSYLDETRKNEDSTELGLPTDDTPPVDDIFRARFDTTSWSLVVAWAWKDLDLSAGYTRTDIDSDAHIVYVTGSTFFPAFDIFTTRDRTSYVSDQDIMHADVRYDFGKGWSAGLHGRLFDTSGTYAVESRQFGTDVRYELPMGLYFRVAYDRYDHDEDNPYAGDPASRTPGVNNYDADLWVLAAGYRF